ncbi:ATP synthase mitochondrial F1 complex assembly factor 2 [Octopus sinensis]|uniref:ATP synthase mitochondrial F1 complex assembly factor 2 n=1 Tax=Octopus sinensis TaxID=2607531 RepID=A0A6P7S8Z4_9MOLL|nr:ATP synthase mitochondrial F1 complex assembly factor 2 [Octopus sinensis]
MASAAANGVLQRFHPFLKKFPLSNAINTVFTRKLHSKELKKFYKTATISQNNGQFEINLDKRKLRTPLGNVFIVPNESLALAVATEWNGQKNIIKQNKMHLTTLCNTAIDNPLQRSKTDLIRSILHFLETDTLCYRMSEPEDLLELQKQKWDPIIDWFKNRYNVPIETTTTFALPCISDATIGGIHTQLNSYTMWGLTGIFSAVECVKSLILTMGLVERHLTVNDAVFLSRLEMEFQTQKWGSVEWYHDLDLYENRARLAAAVLFTHWSSENASMKQKTTAKMRAFV